MQSVTTLDETCINTHRFLAVDTVRKAITGHPGLPLGSAAMADTLWDRFLEVNPAEAERERFRRWDSQTPGHPEFGETPGVEATTGPLGQGFANAVGMAIAETALVARFNRPGHPVVDHFTNVIASGGDLMDEVSAQASSLAGHLRLGKRIVLDADNQVSLSGSTICAVRVFRIFLCY
jgi:transketolase